MLTPTPSPLAYDVAVISILLACATTPEVAVPDPTDDRLAAPTSGLPDFADPLPDPSDPAAYEPTYYDETTVVGTVKLSTDEGAKSQPVTLSVEGGQDVLLAYHPTPEWSALEGKRVQLTGRPWRPSPYAAQITMLHFDATRIEVVAE